MMIVRMWKTHVDPRRIEEFETFAKNKSLPMFKLQDGFKGVLFLRGEGDKAVTISLWRDMAAVEKLGDSASYRSTVSEITRAGFLTGEQSVEIFELFGSDLDATIIARVNRR